MTSKMVVLIGEQPIPNLLPVLHIKPTAVLLVQTKFTEPTGKRLKSRLRQDGLEVQSLTIRDPYDIPSIRQNIQEKLTHLGWLSQTLLFNVTGGTKPMSISAYQLAQQNNCLILYLQSEGQQTRMRRYRLDADQIIPEANEILPTLITIDDYLRVYLPGYSQTGFSKDQHGNIDAGGRFEKIIHDTLKPHVDEVMAGVRPEGVKKQIDIDLVIRQGNQVGIAEIKTGGADKRGLDQLSTAGGRAYLGIYTAKFWIVGVRDLRSELRALANARNVNIIHLPGYRDGKKLNPKEANRLINTVLEKLGSRKR
ncbi:MAG: DUF1887 family protein [Chloroflexi bacterium]|nr:MAG: DUF1887 family protein [Chloroflexota bacterium]